jgi:hypothetical protein
MEIEQYIEEAKNDFNKLFGYMATDMAEANRLHDIKMFLANSIRLAHQQGRLEVLKEASPTKTDKQTEV